MAFPSSFTQIEIEQQIKFGWNEDTIKQFISEMPTKKYLYIQHGRNVLNADNMPVEDVEPHYHLYIWFNYAVPTKNILAKLNKIGCSADVQQLEKIKKNESAVAYATHENVDKPKYSRDGIVANFEYNEIIDKEVARKNAKHNSERANEILDMVDKGEIKEYNLHEKLSIVEYNTYKRDIENGFSYRANRLRNEVDRIMECIFISGESGTGKTTYAKQLAKQHNYSVFVSSGSNDVLDGYAGQECIILDDLRASSMALADLLKMLDNNTASTVKSRYRNKILECRLIIITTTMNINTFFNNVFKEDKESAIQLKRRCRLLVRMTQDNIETWLYNESLQDYECVGKMPNVVLAEFKKPELSGEEKLSIVKNMLGGLGDMLKNVSERVEDYQQMDLREIINDNPWKH